MVSASGIGSSSALIVVLLFGGGRLSDMMGDVAKGIKSFKKGMTEDDEAEHAPPDRRASRRSSARRARAADAAPSRSGACARRPTPIAPGLIRLAAGKGAMFGIDSSELLVIALVALVVIGPKDLPRVMRTVGQWVGRARGMARHFRTGVDTMIRESELADMEKKWRADNERIMREFRHRRRRSRLGQASAGTENEAPPEPGALPPSPPKAPPRRRAARRPRRRRQAHRAARPLRWPRPPPPAGDDGA